VTNQRTAAITGSASGIGAAIRARLETDGWRVIGVDRPGQGQEVEADLATLGGRADAIAGVLEATQGRLDALVPDPGLGPHLPSRAPLVAVNYFGAIEVLDGLFGALQQGDQPAAVLISSNSISMTPMKDTTLIDLLLAGDEPAALEAAERFDGPSVYAMTKVALARAARARVQAWGDLGVRLNLVAPGPVRTPLLQATKDDPELGKYVDLLPIPLGREGEAAEIAGPVAFLLGPDATNIHGSLLFVDGGTDALFRPDHA
jgi:NAD(P)-dependent dehydrogenase (short-subunit alcohol dehydrogenase family)